MDGRVTRVGGSRHATVLIAACHLGAAFGWWAITKQLPGPTVWFLAGLAVLGVAGAALVRRHGTRVARTAVIGLRYEQGKRFHLNRRAGDLDSAGELVWWAAWPSGLMLRFTGPGGRNDVVTVPRDALTPERFHALRLTLVRLS